MTMRLLLLITALVAGIAGAAPMSAANTAHTRVALIAEHQSLTPGAENWLGLWLEPAAGWHTYWRNPGQAGLPTEIDWHLPEGLSAGAIDWPAPQRLITGKIVSYGYDSPVLLLVPLQVAAAVAGPLTIAAHARWLVCKEICIPEQADLSLPLSVGSAPGTADSRFAAALARLPQALPDADARFQLAGGQLRLAVQLPQSGDSARWFPAVNGLIDDSAEQRVVFDDGELRLAATASARAQAPALLDGVLEVDGRGQQRAYALHAVPGAVPPLPPPAYRISGLWWSLALGVLGGLILNLMPCVFPVLAIKALTLVHAKAGRARAHAAAYSLGVVTSMLAVGSLLLLLRAGGQALGWGFQLQSPVVVAALALLMFALGLWMSGVVSFGGAWMGLGQRLTERQSFSGSFATGVLAVVVASPCTAPFMGGALGFALTQPPAASLAVFAALGIGLALPFLVLALAPRLVAWLPSPGPWMETFKEILAFPLYLTAVWLIWVLARQSGADAAALALAAMVLVAAGLWARGRWPHARASAVTLAVTLLGAGALLANPMLRARSIAVAPAAGGPAATLTQQPYSAQRLAQLRAAGRTVFIDFTADWCVTCKVNERLTLRDSAVLHSFAEHDVAWLVGDWTRSDPEITRVLTRFGRPGVPLYLVYRGQAPARVLPQLLTPATVEAAVAGRD